MEINRIRLFLLFIFCGFVFVQSLPTNVPEYVIEDILDEDENETVDNVDEVAGLLKTDYLNETEQTKVLYTGSQVWKVKIENSKQLRVLSELRKQKGIITLSIFIF